VTAVPMTCRRSTGSAFHALKLQACRLKPSAWPPIRIIVGVAAYKDSRPFPGKQDQLFPGLGAQAQDSGNQHKLGFAGLGGVPGMSRSSIIISGMVLSSSQRTRAARIIPLNTRVESTEKIS